MLPHPYGLPIAAKKIVDIPGAKARIGPLSAQLSLQFGSGSGQSGRVLGFAIQTDKNIKSIKWLFRQDYHPMAGHNNVKDFVWEDNSHTTYDFHYHVNKKL